MTRSAVRQAVALVAGATFAMGVHAAGDPAAGARKAETCFGCHAIPGYNSVYPSYRVPKIGGQHADYLVAALKAYRAEQRQHATMRAQAKTLSDQDMADIAAFFAAQK